MRRIVQLFFLLLNIWIAYEFYRFVRFYETAGATGSPNRPPGVEGWLPIASLMNLKIWLVSGAAPRVHPAGMFLLLAFTLISFILRKTFCSWLCPVGTVSEYLWSIGQRVLRGNGRLPKWADLPLRSLKYILLGLFAYVVVSMPVPDLRAFMEGPYGIIADVKMLNFFRYLSVTAAVILGVLAALSLIVRNFWCRYLCPYGALMGLFSWRSPLRIRREAKYCIDCAKCANACPSYLAVDKLVSIGSIECTACLQCVAACPAEGALYLSLPVRQRKAPAWAVAAAIAAIFLGFYAGAKLTGHWQTPVSNAVYMELIPHAGEYAHP